MTKKKSKRLLSFLLSLVMVFTLTALPVFAEGTTDGSTTEGTIETVSNVAKVGNVEYSTLADAIDKATSGDTVTLLSNVKLTETINIYKSITLDLGNYTIESTAEKKAIYTTQTLTIKAENGGITSTGYVVLNQKGTGTGTLIINGGTYTSSADHAIYNFAGTVTIENGTISSTCSGKAGIYNTSNGTVTVKDGAVNGVKYGIYSSGAVTITGGTVTGTSESSSYGVYLASGATISISGGTIKGYEGLRQPLVSTASTASENEETTANTADVVISGGSIEGITHAVNVSTTATISGGTFTATGTKDQYAVALYSTGATITVSGGTFRGMYSTAWINSAANGSITIADGYAVNTGTLTDSNSSDEALERTVGRPLGGSGDSSTKVVAESVSSEGTATMYAKVSAENIGSFSTENYPTTALTFTDDNGKTHSYIFAGWYEDSTGTTACTEIPTSEAYAKFVDADVLSVICVYTPASVTKSNPAWRFVSSLDSGNYDEFYFCIGSTTQTVTTYYNSSTVGSVDKTFTSSNFSEASKYVTSYGFMDTATTPATSYTVTAGWKTADGTTVYGASYTFDASNYASATILYGSVE